MRRKRKEVIHALGRRGVVYRHFPFHSVFHRFHSLSTGQTSLRVIINNGFQNPKVPSMSES